MIDYFDLFSTYLFPHKKRNSKYKLHIYYFTFKLNTQGRGATHNFRPHKAIYYFGAFFSFFFPVVVVVLLLMMEELNSYLKKKKKQVHHSQL